MNLPYEPGLSRRLAYGRYIRSLHRARFNRYGGLYYEQLIRLQNVKIGLSETELACIFKNDVLITEFFCSICQEQNQEEQNQEQKIKNKTLICDHTFHNKCIKKWLSENKTCPVCRFDLRY